MKKMVFSLLALAGCGHVHEHAPQDHVPDYAVARASGAIKVDGRHDEAAWSVVALFINPNPRQDTYVGLGALPGAVPAREGRAWTINLNRWDGMEPHRKLSMWSASGLPAPNPHASRHFGLLLFTR